MRKLWLLFSLALLSLTCLARVAFSGSPHIVVASAVSPSISWNGSQWVQADKKGNVFLLRGDSLDVYPFSASRLANPRRLLRSGLVENGTTSAALSPDGDRWIVAASNHVTSFESGEARALPDVGWLVTSVGFLGNAAVAGVLPMSVGRGQVSTHPVTPPLVVESQMNGWTTRIGGSLPRRARGRDPMDALFAEHTVRLARDGANRLWVGYPYLGKVARYTATGKRDFEVVVGSGAARFRKDEATLRFAFREGLRKQGYDTDNAKTGAFTANLGIRGMTVAPDGLLYLLLDGSLTGETLLARVDPSQGTVEGTPVGLAHAGELGLAAGSDGLYLAAPRAAEGRWRIAWTSLENADWFELPNARLGTS